MNQFKSLHGDKPTDPPIEWESQPPAVQFKYRTSPPKTIPVVSGIIGRLNQNYVDNGDVEVYPSEYPFKSTSNSVPDMDTTLIKSIYDDEMDQLM